MISLFGATYGFLNWWPLLALPLGTGLLVYAYLRRGQGERLHVATLMFLKDLRRSSRSRRKFVPPVRFFFELLLLLLLIAGAAGFYREGSGEKIALLVDNSFSMLAHLQAGSETLFEDAVGETRSVVQSSNAGALFKLYVTSPGLKALSDRFEPADEVLARLAEIRPLHAADSLDAVLAKVVLDSGADRTLVFTDKRLRGKAENFKNRDRIRFYTLGQAGEIRKNLAVSAINLMKASLGQNSVGVKATISAFSPDGVKGRVRVQGVAAHDQAKSALVDLQSKEVSFAGGEARAVVFENLPQYPAYRVEVQPAVFDAIEGDNSAWIGTGGHRSSIGLIGNFSARDLGLEQIQGVSFSSWSGARFAELSADPGFWASAKAPSALIFHRLAPKELPPRSALFVLPPENNALFPAYPEVHSPQVTRFEPSHPINTYLNYPALTLRVLTPLKPQPWTRELLSTTRGSALLIGEKNGQRYAALGFELFPYAGKESPLLSILTLNLVRWLSDFSLDAGFLPVWSTQKIEAGELASLTTESVTSGDFESSKRTGPAVIALEQPGVLKLTGSSGEERLSAINFLNEQESDTLTLKEVLPPSVPAAAAASGFEREPFTNYLATIVLVLMLLDMLLAMRRGLLGL